MYKMSCCCCCVAVVKALMLNAVISHSGFEQLKTEVECCYSTLAQFDSTVHSALKQLLQQSSQVYVLSFIHSFLACTTMSA